MNYLRLPFLPRILIGLLFAGLLLCLPLAAEAGSAEAKALLAAKRGPEAYAAYLALWRDNPSDDEVLLGLARSAALAGQRTRAMLAYETLTRRYPDQAVLHRELADVYRALGNTEAARREAALAEQLGQTEDGTPASLLTVHGRVGAGIQYDTNINLGPDSRDVTVEGITFFLPADLDAENAWGSYLNARLDLRRRLAVDSPWSLVADLDASQTLFMEESHAITWGRMAAGFSYEMPSWTADIRVKGEEVFSDLEDLVALAGVEGSHVFSLTPAVQFVTRAELGERNFTGNDQRDGSYGWVGEYVRLLLGNGDYSVEAGGRLIGNWCSGSLYDSTAWETSALIRAALPYSCEAQAFVSYGRETYASPSLTILTRDRKDDKLRAGLGLVHNLTRALSVDVQYQHVTLDSNTALFDYDRDIVSTGLSWSF